MSSVNSKSWIVAAVAASLVFATAGTLVPSVRADESMKEPAMAADPALEAAAMKHADMMKKMVAEPSKVEKVETRMAKAMVLDKMTKMLAMDPKFQQMCMADMEDADMKKAHDAAKTMAEDPAQMKTMMEQIEKDPEAMTIITHNAAMMAMMKEKGGMAGMMDKGQKMMGDKMNNGK